MIGPCRYGLVVAALAMTAIAAPARSTELCGWLVETIGDESMHEFTLWLEADGDVSFLYKMTGKGVSTESSKAYSPGSGTFSLRPKAPEKAWGFGTTIDGAGDVDIVADIHVMPKSVFDETETPLLASFTFRRRVPEGEKKPPADFAKRQCATVPGQH
jgi:hypothetical protein